VDIVPLGMQTSHSHGEANMVGQHFVELFGLKEKLLVAGV